MPLDTFRGCNICSLKFVLVSEASYLEPVPCFSGCLLMDSCIADRVLGHIVRSFLEYLDQSHLIYKILFLPVTKILEEWLALFYGTLYRLLLSYWFSVYRLEWCCGEWDLRILLPFMLHLVKYTMLKSIWPLFASCFHYCKQNKLWLHQRSLQCSR